MSADKLPLGGLVALNAGKAVRWVSRTTGRGGTALPGRTANALHPRLVGEMARGLRNGLAVVTGTNGKTTTTRIIAAALRQSGLEPVTNREGANLMQGIATALLTQADSKGRFQHPDGVVGLFEVDEGVLPVAIAEMSPRMIVVTNLFRDQLDRYFEIDFVAALWTAALAKLPATSTLVLNADDPLVAYLGAEISNPVVYYGIEDGRSSAAGLERSADSRRCPRCSSDLEYDHAVYAHLGHYSCPSCGWRRPKPSIHGLNVVLEGSSGSTAELVTPAGNLQLRIPLPGMFNVYNAIAAAAAALTLGARPSAVTEAIAQMHSAFGRMETLEVGGRKVSLEMAKNPSGFNQVFEVALKEKGNLHLLLALNNNPQDSRDVSWIWDIDAEALKGRLESLVVSGMRADEMVLRLKYASVIGGGNGSGAPPLSVIADLTKALDEALASTPAGETLHVIANYSAMWAIRNELVRRGHLAPFWEV
ncbi:MAG: MurT ligase domain-containing protein [Candidatus Dormibacterales bacterium]